jgi:hypothetical protein
MVKFDAPTMIQHRYVATSHSPTPYHYQRRQTAGAHRRRRWGGGGALSIVVVGVGGYPYRAALFLLFSNAFRLPARRIVPGPYAVRTWYNPTSWFCTVRCTYKLVLLCVRTSWFCDPPVLAAALTHSLSTLHYRYSTLLYSPAVTPQEKSHQVSAGYRLQVPCPKDLTPLSSKHMQFQNNNNNNNNNKNCKHSSLATSLDIRWLPGWLFSSRLSLICWTTPICCSVRGALIGEERSL